MAPNNFSNNYLYTYGTPALLVSVAVLQLFLAHTANLSPWKGGGFGMFSTVESPASRVVYGYAITDADTFSVYIGAEHYDQKVKTQSFPTQKNLAHFAQALMKEQWVPYDYQPATQADELIELSDQNSAITTTSTSDVEEEDPPTSSEFVRSLREHEPAPPAEKLISPIALRIEIWQMGFDAGLQEVNLEKMHEVTLTANY